MADFLAPEVPTGIFACMAEEDYHASPGISQSALKLLGEEGGPAKFRYGERRETRPQKLGSLVHSIILEPHKVLDRYRVTRLLRDGTKDWLEESSAHPGKIMVKQAAFEQAMAMADSVYRWSSVARELLTSPDHVSVEQSFWWVDPESGLLCRGRADAIHREFNVIIDLKTAIDASQDGFRRAVRDHGYHLQSWFYQWGWKLAGGWQPVDLVFIVVSKDPPYLTANYVIDKSDLQDARDEIRRLIGIYQECEVSGVWPGYPEGVETLQPLYKNRDW